MMPALSLEAPVDAKRHILLLSHDPVWAKAVRQELHREGGGTVSLALSAQDALNRLVDPSHTYSHLLVEPEAAGPHLRDLVGVSAGETGSQVELLLLGGTGGNLADRTLRRARTPADVAALLETGAQPAADRPPLTTSEVALTFRADQLECRFQPIVRLADRKPVGLETLVRMAHPERGTIGPDHFVPQIERGGLSLRLTEAVARTAMAEVNADFLEAHDLYLALNVPLDVLLFPEALIRIDAHRVLFGIPVGRLLIELTESRPVVDLPALAAAVGRWREAGYRVAVDDMGPEMMHQLDLFDLPFNLIKLDKQIVLRSEHDARARSYLQRTVDRAHARGLSVIAEGVENEAMWNRLFELGVENVQGFLIARAMPASALGAWLSAWSAQGALPRDRLPS